MLCNHFSCTMARALSREWFFVAALAGPHNKLTELISGCVSATVCQEHPIGGPPGSGGASRPSPSDFSRNSNLPARLPQKTFLPSRQGLIPGVHFRRSTWLGWLFPFDVRDGRMTARARRLEPHRFASNIGR